MKNRNFIRNINIGKFVKHDIIALSREKTYFAIQIEPVKDNLLILWKPRDCRSFASILHNFSVIYSFCLSSSIKYQI